MVDFFYKFGVICYLSPHDCRLCVVTAEGPPGADDDDDSVTDNFGGEHELFGKCLMLTVLLCWQWCC